MGLRDRVVVVTGASRGIGLAIAQACAEQGARLALVARSSDAVRDVAATLGPEARAYACHVEAPDEVDSTVARIVADLGVVHGLVNNAGITRDGLLARMSQEAWDEVLRVNLTGTFNFTRAVVKGMMRQKLGRIVNVTSVVGQMGNAGQTNYCASKAGIIGFTKAAARELASRNITVNAVAPGFITTAMTDSLDERARAQLLPQIPLQRLGTPAEVAGVVVFLLGDAAAYVTGQVLNCDGGMWMHS
ncbi:MAG TPA: 3-oxoacyl-[acyl-carrier-protein] reductase [Candidatus Krumholzibacteria bacterium]|nr:3-oxoacyl-[acyl-carrier-protein] reductase [Candidatus Krumholzibacteria bacterium]